MNIDHLNNLASLEQHLAFYKGLVEKAKAEIAEYETAIENINAKLKDFAVETTGAVQNKVEEVVEVVKEEVKKAAPKKSTKKAAAKNEEAPVEEAPAEEVAAEDSDK